MRTHGHWRTAGVASLLLAACYSPNAPTGVPCAPGAAASCPTGQVCEQRDGLGVCVQPGDAVADAGIDGDPRLDADVGADAPPDDPDGDGVATAVDNCPGRANPAQYDEDGDAIGDECDPCPLLRPLGDVQSDLDGDGVGDACDPNPGTAGDRLVLFDSFHAGVPAGWTPVGPWSGSPGAVTAIPSSADALLSPPAPAAAAERFTLTTRVVPGMAFGAEPRGIGLAGPVLPDSSDGVACELVNSAGLTELALVDFSGPSFIDSRPYDFQPGTEYTVTLTRNGSQFTCAVEGPAGMRTLRSSFPSSPAMLIGLGASRFGGHFQWLQYITSP